MFRPALALAAALALLAGPARAQLGPPPTAKPWPLGCPIPSTIANDSDQEIAVTPCPPLVTDAQDNVVSILACPQIVQFLPPGGAVTTYWSQKDLFGQQVPPGLYFVGGVPYDVGGADAGIQALGDPYAGALRRVELCAPTQAGLPYVLAASGSTASGVPLGCGQVFPLDVDALLLTSLQNGAVFPNFIGLLDGTGRTNAPGVAPPANPSLIGVTFHMAFFTVDPLAPCSVGVVSEAITVTVV